MTDDEAAQQRDEIVRRMIATPPKPKPQPRRESTGQARKNPKPKESA